jgi:hypothetical protein
MKIGHPSKKTWDLGIWAISLALIVSLGCKGKGRMVEKDMPLPPTVDGGVINGQFVQVDYGFGFPLPAKWIYTPLSAEQEVDEVARFTDPTRAMLVRLSVQMRDPSQKFSESAWSDAVELDLKNHQFQTLKKDGSREYKTAGTENWVMKTFRIKDGKNMEWVEEEWALPKDDLLIVAHASIPKETAETENGKKLFKAIEGSLGQITWYLPIGTRGISVGRYELQHLTVAFAKALESRSAARVGNFFDEMYPDKGKWDVWYAQVTAGNPKNFEIQAQLSGLVINGDYATASYTLVRKDKGDAKPQRFEKNFKLTKKEGTWKIAASLDKE